MLNLYYKPSCPFCLRVLTANEKINAPLALRDITADSATRDELITKGGKGQVPYLEDTDKDVAMYESLDIIEYLSKYYSNGVVPDTQAPCNVCPID
jgi:glutathione S-transferase